VQVTQPEKSNAPFPPAPLANTHTHTQPGALCPQRCLRARMTCTPHPPTRRRRAGCVRPVDGAAAGHAVRPRPLLPHPGMRAGMRASRCRRRLVAACSHLPLHMRPRRRVAGLYTLGGPSRWPLPLMCSVPRPDLVFAPAGAHIHHRGGPTRAAALPDVPDGRHQRQRLAIRTAVAARCGAAQTCPC
jgi:hypothetical protein